MKALPIQGNQIQDLAHPTARILIASYFMAKSVGLVLDPNSMHLMFAANAVPEYVKWPHIGFEFVAAAAIMIGFHTRLAAALLSLHLFWTSFIINYVPGDAIALGAFWRDLALIGGLLMLFSHGRGRYAIDNKLENQTPVDEVQGDVPEFIELVDGEWMQAAKA